MDQDLDEDDAKSNFTDKAARLALAEYDDEEHQSVDHPMASVAHDALQQVSAVETAMSDGIQEDVVVAEAATLLGGKVATISLADGQDGDTEMDASNPAVHKHMYAPQDTSDCFVAVVGSAAIEADERRAPLVGGPAE